MRPVSIILLLLALFYSSPALYAQGGEAELAEKYFSDGDFESALALFEKLHRKQPDEKVFVVRAVECYRGLGKYTEGISWLDKAIRQNPAEYPYVILQAGLYKLSGEDKKSEQLHEQVITKMLTTQPDFMAAGLFYYQINDQPHAMQVYQQGRKMLKYNYAFASEIARLYSLSGKWGLAAKEYINQYYDDPTYINGVKAQILNLYSPDAKAEVEQTLLAEVQVNPNDIGIRQILFEFYVVASDFYEAFVQVKSIDKVFRQGGEEVFKYAMTLRNNKNYTLSNQALDYIIENHSRSNWYFQSHQEKTVNQELIAFEKIPLDTNDIRQAVNAYSSLLDEFGRKNTFFRAMYRRANLLAFYLYDLDGAMKELEGMTVLPLTAEEMAETNLLVGDIYLMQKKYFQAEAKYNGVAEMFKEGQIGAMGKFRQGRLYYFKGDFEFAKSRLESIKGNTSNDISNDAIKLHLLIQDNTGLDSTTVPMQKFAAAQLLVFQRDFDSALVKLDSLLYEFPEHTLADEILWEKANIWLAKNDVNKGMLFLDKILEAHGEDVLGDDALFTKARLYDYALGNRERAQQLYIEFLKKYPGSLFIVDVRKRVREMRNG